MSRISDLDLQKLGETIGDNPKLRRLCIHLGIASEKIRDLRKLNRDGSAEGTIDLFTHWKEENPNDQKAKMKNALKKSGLAEIAADFFARDTTSDSETHEETESSDSDADTTPDSETHEETESSNSDEGSPRNKIKQTGASTSFRNTGNIGNINSIGGQQININSSNNVTQGNVTFTSSRRPKRAASGSGVPYGHKKHKKNPRKKR